MSAPVEGSELPEPAASGELTAADSEPEPVVDGVEVPELPEPPPLEPFDPPELPEERARTVTVPCMLGWIEQM